jgi:Tfp pilus assembly protein PilX
MDKTKTGQRGIALLMSLVILLLLSAIAVAPVFIRETSTL